jgi:predicted metalloprotease with PDZ domain
MVHRAGLSSQAEYLDALSNKIEELQTTPGRAVQPVDRASFDAWIKYYRPDENSGNTSVSYYTKGAVIAFLLDARIRKLTGGAKSLDDVMRAAYQKFSDERGYTPEEFRAVAEQVAGQGLAPLWASAVEGTAELDYSEALETLGLRFRPATPPAPDRPVRPWLGITTRNDNGRLLVSTVRRDTPAMAAGLNVDDEILAIDEFRVRADQLNARLDQYKAGDTVTLLVARRDQLRRLELELGAEPPRQWRVEVDRAAGNIEQQQRTRWLKPAA